MRRKSPPPAVKVRASAFVLSIVSIANAQVIVGPNVNMGGGPAFFEPPSTIVGDPFLQRQIEPSIAVSSRNPCELLAGANDYRMVDVEDPRCAGTSGLFCYSVIAQPPPRISGYDCPNLGRRI